MDTGTTGRVALTRMCGGSPPQLYSIPAQAVQGSLHGVQPVSSLSVPTMTGWTLMCYSMLGL